MIKNNKDRYGVIAKTFHWTIAVLIISMLFVGVYMTDLPEKDPNRMFYYWIHKSTGVFVFALIILRLLWRWINKVPDFPANMPKWQKAAARYNHYLLYILMVVMPLSGILMSMFGGYPIDVYGLFAIPSVAQKPNIVAFMGYITHMNLIYAWIALLGLHLLAAMYHHFWRRDNILLRILPGTK